MQSKIIDLNSNIKKKCKSIMYLRDKCYLLGLKTKLNFILLKRDICKKYIEYIH